MVDFPISFDNLTKGETIGFLLSILGTILIVALSIRATLTTGVVPKYEQQAFTVIFICTIILLGGVVISHYTTILTEVLNKVR